MAKISQGSIVRLKTGGPKMVVDGTNMEGTQLTCKWFSKKKLRSSMIHEASLKVLKDGSKANGAASL